jgi:hypothetical protein
MRFFKRIWGVIANPKETLKDISNSPSIWEAISVVVGISLISTLFMFNRNYFMNIARSYAITPAELNDILLFLPVFLTFGVFGSMILAPILHFISVSVYSLLCSFFGYEGKNKGLFATLAFANIPTLLLNVINFLLQYVKLNVIGIFITLAFWIWVFVLKIFAIKETYSMGGGKATLIFFIPTLVIISVLGLGIMVFIISILPIADKIPY